MNSTGLKTWWRLAATFGFAVPACVFVAGCANRNNATNSAAAANVTPPTELVTFYAVPLRCPAAPEIGCGSLAKPILRQLEVTAGIKEAWLNRAGTQLAIVWTEAGSPKTRRNILQSVLEEWKLTATKLSGHAHAHALKEFESGVAWHRADAVDRLSEEEAGIIAARFIRRIQAKTPLPDAKAETLQLAMTNTLKERFLRSSEKFANTPEEEREAFLQAAASYLNETELTALREAIASGFRPLAGEK